MVPQVLQIPSSIFGAGQVLFGHRRRALAGPTGGGGRATGVGARMGLMVLRGLGRLTLGGFGVRPMVTVGLASFLGCLADYPAVY